MKLKYFMFSILYLKCLNLNSSLHFLFTYLKSLKTVFISFVDFLLNLQACDFNQTQGNIFLDFVQI